MAHSPPSLDCPRCGYDVSGVVPTWTEHCPLTGRCSECGLDFDWVDVFRPERITPSWSFEHARTRRFRALCRTLPRVLSPVHLWRRMKLAAPVRLPRLAFLAALALCAAHAIAVAAAIALNRAYLWKTIWTPVGVAGKTTVKPVFDFMLVARLTAWPYTFGWERLVGPLGLIVLVWALLVPMPFFILEQTMAKLKVRSEHLLRGWANSLVIVAAMLAADVLIMAAPPLIMGAPTTRRAPPSWTMLGPLLFLPACAWLIWWWWLFTSAYLRFPHARGVTAAMLTISLLGSLAICVTWDPILHSKVGWWLNAVAGWNAY